MKLKINILHLKQIGLLLMLFIPIYLFFVKYGYGAVLFGISQKMYKHDNVSITLPWGWFNGRLKDEYPLFFNTYDKKDMIVFDYYENTDADNADKYEIAFIDKTADAGGKLTPLEEKR